MGIHLKVIKGEQIHECFDLEVNSKMVVGRGVNSDIQILDHGLSRLHFVIERRDLDFVLRDLKSCNGTFLNGRRIGEAVLAPGDIVTSGETQFEFVDPGSTSHTTAVLISSDQHSSVVETIRPRTREFARLTSSILTPGKPPEDNVHETVQALSTMYKVTSAIHNEREPRQLFELILNSILEVIDADRGFLLLHDRETDTLDAVAYHLSTLDSPGPASGLSISRTIADESILNGNATISSDAMSDRRFQAEESVFMHHIRSVMCVPLEGQDTILGCLYVDTLASRNVFTEDQLELLSAIGRQSGLALERALLHEEIRKSEERLRGFIENCPDAIIETTLNGQIVSFNEQFLRVFGYERDQLEGLTAESFYYRQNARDQVLTLYDKDGFIRNQEIEMKDSRGRRIIASVSGRIARDAKSGEGKIESIIRDITKRKELENLLSSSEERYRHTFEQAPALIAAISPTGEIKDLNDFGCKVLGIPTPSLESDPLRCDEFFPLEDEFFHLLTAAEPFEAHDVPVASRHQTTAYFDIRGAPLKDPQGEITGAVLLAKDITQQKELQSQVLQQEKMASVGILAAGIAHEFNNIIASLMGYAQLAGRQDDFDYEKFRETILKQADRGRQIVDSLMSFSRQSGRERTAASIDEILDDALLLVRKEIEKNQIALDLQRGDVRPTSINVGEIQQVFLNLMINAIQAMSDKGGTLTIQTSEEDSWITIAFRDTGMGIPSHHLGKIFQPFFTTKGAIGQSKTPGTGLGLSVSYNLIKKHGGDLIVESEEGVGTTFLIRLPAADPTQESRTRRFDPTDILEHEPNLGLRILVVDDEPSIREVMTGFFDRNEVVAASSGKDAILEFARHRFDLVFLDIELPGEFDGLATFDRIRAVDPEARIVFMTGTLDNERAREQIEKADGIVRKPFKVQEIYRHLARG